MFRAGWCLATGDGRAEARCVLSRPRPCIDRSVSRSPDSMRMPPPACALRDQMINLAPSLDTVDYEAAGLATYVNVTAQLLAAAAWHHFRSAAHLLHRHATNAGESASSPQDGAAPGRRGPAAAAAAEQELLQFASTTEHGGHSARHQLYSLLEHVFFFMNTSQSTALALRCRATARRLASDNPPHPVSPSALPWLASIRLPCSASPLFVCRQRS